MGIIKRLKVYNVSLGEERERERFQIPNSEWSFPWIESMIELQRAVRWCGENKATSFFVKPLFYLYSPLYLCYQSINIIILINTIVDNIHIYSVKYNNFAKKIC